MIHLRNQALCLLLALASTFNASAQTGEDADERSFFVVPFALYSSDTGTGFGVAGIKSYRRDLPRVSTAKFNVIYTLKEQLIAGVTLEQYFHDGSNRLLAGIEYKKFPSDFFGIGNNTSNDNPEGYTPEYFEFQVFYERQLYRKLKLRPGFFLKNLAVVDTDPGGVLKTEAINWSHGRFDAGPGIGLAWDSRDNTQATRIGTFAALDVYRVMLQDKGDDFTLTTLDIRWFGNPTGELVFATNAVIRDTQGDVPFYHYSNLGGEADLRGYEQGRFRDKSMVLIQQDIRFPIWWRFGGAVFIAAGQVAPRLAQVFDGAFHVAYGIGGRFYINREDRLLVRGDLAFSDDSSGFYISFGEAY